MHLGIPTIPQAQAGETGIGITYIIYKLQLPLSLFLSVGMAKVPLGGAKLQLRVELDFFNLDP